MANVKEKEKNTEDMHVRLTPETRRILEAQAAENGLTISAYIRFLVYQEAKKSK